MEAGFDAVKSNIAKEAGTFGPLIKANWSGQTGDGRSERGYSRNVETF